MQKIRNVYLGCALYQSGMVHIFFCLGARDAQKNVGLKILCAHTKFLRGVEVGRGMEME